MDIKRLEQILDSGWSPSVEQRIDNALEYLSDTDISTVRNAIDPLIKQFEAQLQLQTQNLTGSGNQQDFIDAYLFALRAAEGLKVRRENN